MNKTRRKEIAEIALQLRDIGQTLSAWGEEEQEKADNMPENLQGSDRYEEFERAADGLSEADQTVCQVADELDDYANE